MSSVCLSVHLSVTIRYRPVARNFQVGVLSLTVLARGESVTQRADGVGFLGGGFTLSLLHQLGGNVVALILLVTKSL